MALDGGGSRAKAERENEEVYVVIVGGLASRRSSKRWMDVDWWPLFHGGTTTDGFRPRSASGVQSIESSRLEGVVGGRSSSGSESESEGKRALWRLRIGGASMVEGWGSKSGDLRFSPAHGWESWWAAARREDEADCDQFE
jgi:hypothetical protein